MSEPPRRGVRISPPCWGRCLQWQIFKLTEVVSYITLPTVSTQRQLQQPLSNKAALFVKKYCGHIRVVSFGEWEK